MAPTNNSDGKKFTFWVSIMTMRTAR